MELKPGEVVEELLEGDLKIIQNTALYRFTSDSVLLTRFVKGKKRDTVADFCAGSGIVGLHFYALNPHISVVCTRVQDIGREYDDKFSLVLCNPPYETGGFENGDYKKAICRKEITVTLSEIVDAAYRVLKFGGRLALVNRADRLAEVLYAMKSRGIEPKRLQFVRGRAGAKPYLILVEGTKGAKEGVEILPDAVNVKN